ncbi:MAG: hypothetical protein WBD99_16180 [Thermodesulfobacteriota bacterium]
MRIKILLFTVVLLLFLPSNTFAQKDTSDTTEKEDRWLKPRVISLVQGATSHNQQISSGEIKQYHIMAEPLSHEYNFNDMLKDNMAWDKGVPFQKSHPENYRLSVGIIKLNKVMCGAMLRVKFH